MMRPFGLCTDGALPRLGGSETRPHTSTSVQYLVQATTRSSFPIAARITVALASSLRLVAGCGPRTQIYLTSTEHVGTAAPSLSSGRALGCPYQPEPAL